MTKLKDWLIKNSGSHAALGVVFFMTMCESIFLFIPPEAFIAPPIVSKKRRVWAVIVLAALGSLVGGAIAYLIGSFLYSSVGVWLVDNFSSPEQFEMAQDMFARHGMFVIFLAAFTPVPYKILTICAGFLGFSPALYLLTTGIFRTGRFAITAFIVYRYNNQFKKVLEKYFWPMVAAGITFAILGIFVLSFI
ncbi:MAG: VTT domain-containing protein [Rickettsiales bacterium]|jgi:membrane protein YqaA with SNARE-associated domain|nr:VTT domain-containing protein [Rickettsiales bacterium]